MKSFSVYYDEIKTLYFLLIEVTDNENNEVITKKAFKTKEELFSFLQGISKQLLDLKNKLESELKQVYSDLEEVTKILK